MSQDSECPQTTTTSEEKGEPKQIRTEVLLLTSLTPYRQAKPARFLLLKPIFKSTCFMAMPAIVMRRVDRCTGALALLFCAMLVDER